MTARKSKSWLKWLVLLLLAGGGAGGWFYYSKQSKIPAIDFKTTTVSRGDLTQAVTANGQISAVTNVTVGSQVSGLITAIYVDFNSRVTNGQVIAQVDPSTYQQNTNQAEADLASARASLELTRLEHRRAMELRTNGLISVSDYDKALTDMHLAEATVQTRDAALKKARVDLERTTIYAPVDGIVISRAVDVGQTVAASFNTPTLFNIANDLRQMRIEAMVSEADVGGVEEGQNVTFTVDAFQGRQFNGKVTQVRFMPVTNQNVVNYTTVVGVNNADLKLRPGMTANASIITAQRTNTLRIPNAALRFRPPENAVVLGGTNSTNSASASAGARQRPEGLPTPPWTAEGRRPTQEERQKWMDSLTPEQREQMQKWRERMRAQGGEGGPGGMMGSGGVPRATQEGPVTRTVYLLEKSESPGKEARVLKPVTVKAGITDGTYTEILDGLKDGDVVATGVNLPVSATAAARPGQSSSPFGSPFGGFRPR
jgi:HlyD family secretion protein